MTDRLLLARTELFKFWTRKLLFWLKLPWKKPLEPTPANKNADEAAGKVSALAAWSVLCVQFIFHLIMAPFMRPESARWPEFESVQLSWRIECYQAAALARVSSTLWSIQSISGRFVRKKGKRERESRVLSLPGWAPSRSLVRPLLLFIIKYSGKDPSRLKLYFAFCSAHRSPGRHFRTA